MSTSRPVAGSPDISQTGLAYDIQQTLANSIAMVAQLNANNQGHYDSAIDQYNQNMRTGQTHNPPLPIPVAPLKWQLAQPDQFGITSYQLGPDHLVPTPPLTLDTIDLGTLVATGPNPSPAPGQSAVFVLGPPDGKNAGWWSAGPGDTEPSGYTKTLPDANGNLMTVMKVEVPFGGLYEKIG
jgi:hypothetical protein